MAHDYAEKKIAESLEQANGNATLACNILIEWALEDQMLLMALTQNHLKGIVAHAIERRVSKHTKAVIEKASKPQEKPVTVDLPPESFGRDLLKALSGRDSVRFGLESASGRPLVTKRKKASQQHIDALKRLSVYPPKDHSAQDHPSKDHKDS